MGTDFMTRFEFRSWLSLLSRLSAHQRAALLSALKLLNAVEFFDVKRGWAFSSYASRCIIRAVRRHLAKSARGDERIVTTESVAEPAMTDGSQAAIDAKDAVRAALPLLSERERRVLRLRFGLGREAPVTVREVAKRIGISCERAERIELDALKMVGVYT